jgi:hypothetical protein
VVTLVAFLGIVIPPLSVAVYIIIEASVHHRARRRADELLRAILSCEQYGQLMQRRYIDIPSPSDPDRIYRVPKFAGLVQVREKGSIMMWLCLQPRKWIPDEDIVIMHKLMIEADESNYLRMANHIFPSLIDYDVRTAVMHTD